MNVIRRNTRIEPLGPPSAEDLLPVPEGQRRLGGISRSKVYELVQEGAIVAYRPGGRVRLDARSLAAYLASTRI